MLSIVAHDLKSPLTGIRLGAQLADRWLAHAAPDVHGTVRDQLLNIEAGAEEMLSLMDDPSALPICGQGACSNCGLSRLASSG